MDKAADTVDVVHDEKEHHNAVPTSAFAALTRAQCVKKFWRLYITGLGVSLAGMYVILSTDNSLSNDFLGTLDTQTQSSEVSSPMRVSSPTLQQSKTPKPVTRL